MHLKPKMLLKFPTINFLRPIKKLFPGAIRFDIDYHIFQIIEILTFA